MSRFGPGSRARVALIAAVAAMVLQLALYVVLRSSRGDDPSNAAPTAIAALASQSIPGPAVSDAPTSTDVPPPQAQPVPGPPVAGEPSAPSVEEAPSVDAREHDEEEAPTARQERRRREQKEREERAREQKEREAREQKEREAREQKEREAREQKEREARATAIDSKPAPAAEPRPKPQPQVPSPPSKPAAAPVTEGIVLLLGPGTPSIGAAIARKAYLGQTTVWSNGVAVRPISRSSSSAAAKRFARSVLGMSTGAFGEHWSEIQLSGGGLAPPAVSSAAAMLSKVAATKGAVGYVLASELPASPAGVRVVRVD